MLISKIKMLYNKLKHDNNINKETKIDSMTEVDYDEWIEKTSEEKETYGLTKITNAPEIEVASTGELIIPISYSKWIQMSDEEKEKCGLVKVTDVPQEIL